MSYEFKRFKKDKASIVPIEEIYTDLDVNPNDPVSPQDGYRFDAPRRWSTSRYTNKSVGIRDLHLTPSSGDIRCRFLCYYDFNVNTKVYTWNDDSNKYEDKGQDYYDIANVGKSRCVSNNYMVQLTPQNCFEEIITNMLEFVNGSSWKTLNSTLQSYSTIGDKTHDTSRGLFYVKEVTTTETENDPNSNYSVYRPFDYIMNINFLKIPMSFYYNYDSNSTEFDIKPYIMPRDIVMINRSKSSGVVLNKAQIFTETFIAEDYGLIDPFTEGNIITCYIESSAKAATVQLTELETEITVSDGHSHLRALELLLIIERNDVNSIKAVYNLFNQIMPNVDDLPKITVDDIEYVIPFVTFDEYNSYFDIHHNIEYITPLTNSSQGFRTNLKLHNVWDRIHLMYHASFAETKRRIIGRNGDHWDTPNKQFIVPPNDQDQFYIRFTTDGMHPIIPVGCHFNVDLTFMLNATNNTATGNHDHFKD